MERINMPWLKKEIPHGLWIKCEECDEIIYRKELERNLKVCPKCNYHFRLTWQERVDLLIDKDTFNEFDRYIEADDPLKFKDHKKYKDRLKEGQKNTETKDSMVSGEGNINDIRVNICIMVFEFMGGSMGSVVGEKICRAVERSIENRIPLIIVSCSGGARMQEGVISLMQMAKTSSALARLSDYRLPYISIITNPTTGGVIASFASLGDVVISEPKAMIAFSGPRVIEQTIGEKLPEGFQQADFLLKHGMIDMIIERNQLKNTVSKLLDLLNQKNKK
ncbi:MAG: acetyl-CoA carboxylase carboxyltransferase subunit beta [Candidatus Firestonebacteria bacterium]|nr:acetyl-CoA carboxylase carboxyltransferase subunit beta [Candidatus Firestonebacteria bacterium]